MKDQLLIAGMLEELRKQTQIRVEESFIGKDIYKNLKQNKFDRLVVAGGDGSFSLAINEIIRNDLTIESKFKDDIFIRLKKNQSHFLNHDNYVNYLKERIYG